MLYEVITLVNGVLLKPLPYTEPDRIMVVREVIPERGSAYRSVNALHFDQWLACGCFEDLALSEYVAETTLTPMLKKQDNQKYRAFIAVYADGVRLIDNLRLN